MLKCIICVGEAYCTMVILAPIMTMALLSSFSGRPRPHSCVSRRCLALAPLTLLPNACKAAGAGTFDELQARMEARLVKEPDVAPNAAGASSLPSWLIGRWRCTQTLTYFTTPQGVQFTAAPGQPVSEAEKSAAETRSRIGRPVELELRYLADGKGGAMEDRAFNARSRFDAFAGRPVVRSSAACEAEDSRIKDGRSAADVRAGRLVACTLIDFKGGGATQKVLVNSLRVGVSKGDSAGTSGESVAFSEFTRSTLARILAPGDTRNFP